MKNKKIIRWLVVILLIVLLCIFLFTIFNKKNTKSSESTILNNQTSETAYSSDVLYIPDWDFYKNEDLGISIQHPKNMSAIEYLSGGVQKFINFKYDDMPSSSYSLMIVDNKDKTFKNDEYRIIYSHTNDFNVKKIKVSVGRVTGTRYIVDDNANGKNMADDIIFEKDGKTYVISATIKDDNFDKFYRTFDFIQK